MDIIANRKNRRILFRACVRLIEKYYEMAGRLVEETRTFSRQNIWRITVSAKHRPDQQHHFPVSGKEEWIAVALKLENKVAWVKAAQTKDRRRHCPPVCGGRPQSGDDLAGRPPRAKRLRRKSGRREAKLFLPLRRV